jgi:hypothetical protein
MIASNDKIAVAACHLDEGRRVIDLLRKCIASGERTPPCNATTGRSVSRYSRYGPASLARCRIADVVKPSWLRQEKVAI